MHNEEQLDWFLQGATQGVPKNFTDPSLDVPVMYLQRGDAITTIIKPTSSDGGSLSTAVLQSSLVVLHFPMLRFNVRPTSKFNAEATICVKSKGLWLALLQGYGVLPSLLDLLHSEEGGVLSFTSYATGHTLRHSGENIMRADAEASRPVAFHLAYVPSGMLTDECAIYARCDLIAGRWFVLVMGVMSTLPHRDFRFYRHVTQCLRASNGTTTFHVIRDVLICKIIWIRAREALPVDPQRSWRSKPALAGEYMKVGRSSPISSASVADCTVLLQWFDSLFKALLRLSRTGER